MSVRASGVVQPGRVTSTFRLTATASAWSTGPIPAPSGKPCAIAPVTYSLAAATASGTASPSASREATALASVQPVPWVCRLSSRADRYVRVSPVAVSSRSTASPCEVAALDQHPAGPSASTASAARRRSASPSRP